MKIEELKQATKKLENAIGFQLAIPMVVLNIMLMALIFSDLFQFISLPLLMTMYFVSLLYLMIRMLIWKKKNTLKCPHCSTDIASREFRLIIIASGNCPSCGNTILDKKQKIPAAALSV